MELMNENLRFGHHREESKVIPKFWLRHTFEKIKKMTNKETLKKQRVMNGKEQVMKN